MERFKTLGYVPVGGKPEVLKHRIESDYKRFGDIIRANNIKGD
jgi:tripartite-type tricarboxylate transporter receptor subunit TctC